MVRVSRRQQTTQIGSGINYGSQNTPEAADPDPAPIDQGDIDLIEKHIKALALVFAEKTGMTIPQLKAAFRAKMDSLP